MLPIYFSGRHFRLFFPYRSTLSCNFKQSILLSGNAEKCVTNGKRVRDAHVRSFVIVEAYNPLEFPLASLIRGDGHPVEPFRLQYAISPLCDGIIQRVAALCHANLVSRLLRMPYIVVFL